MRHNDACLLMGSGHYSEVDHKKPCSIGVECMYSGKQMIDQIIS